MYELYHLVMNAEADDKPELMFTVTLVDDDPLFLEQMKDFLLSMKITQIEEVTPAAWAKARKAAARSARPPDT